MSKIRGVNDFTIQKNIRLEAFNLLPVLRDLALANSPYFLGISTVIQEIYTKLEAKLASQEPGVLSDVAAMLLVMWKTNPKAYANFMHRTTHSPAEKTLDSVEGQRHFCRILDALEKEGHTYRLDDWGKHLVLVPQNTRFTNPKELLEQLSRQHQALTPA